MTFLELAIRGVRNFSDFSRIPLRAGFNTVYGGNQSGKTTVWQILRLMLAPERTQRGVEDANGWGQAALTFRGNDGETYCLAHHYGEQVQKLARREGDRGFEPVSLIDGHHDALNPGFGQRPSLWPLCIGGVHWLPSLTLLREKSGVPAPDPEDTTQALDESPDDGKALMVQDPFGMVELATRLDELDGIEVDTAEAADLESALAECYDKRTLLHKRLDTLSSLDAERAHIGEQMEPVAAAASLPDDIEEDIARYLEEADASRDQRVAIDQQIVDHEDALEKVKTIRLRRRPDAYIGVALLGGAALAAGTVGAHPWVLGLLGAGIPALSVPLARKLRQRSQRSELTRGIERLREELHTLDNTLEENHAGLSDVMATNGFASPRSALNARRRHAALRRALDDLDQRENKILGGHTREDIEDTIQRLEERINGIQEAHGRLRASGADMATVRREKAELSRAIITGEGNMEAPEPLDISIEPHLMEDPAYRELLQQKRDAYCERASELLARFTRGEFSALSINGAFYPTLHREGRDDATGHTPSAGMADLIYLAQYLAMVETLDPDGHFPLVLDEPCLTLDMEHRSLVYNTLRECARVRQVVLLTCQQVLTSPNDHVVRLKG